MVISKTLLIATILAFSAAPASAGYQGLILQLGGGQARAMLGVYAVEGTHGYVGDHGTSFGPFQLHYPGLGNEFTRQTGLRASNPRTVPAQIAFMRRWGASHGGFSPSIWHGLRGRHHGHRRHHRRLA